MRRRALLQSIAKRACSTSTTTSSSYSSSWESLGLLPELASALRNVGFASPSAPQRLAVPPLLAGKSVAFASSTGSGKTLAFLLPTLQQLRQQEIAQPLLRQASDKCRPRAIVLAPTRDLTSQIGEAAKSLAHQFRVRVRTAEGGSRIKTNISTLETRGADLLVATPARLRLLHRRDKVSLRAVRHIIVDEADDMLLRGFDDDLSYLLGKCPPREPPRSPMGAEYVEGDDWSEEEAAPLSPQVAFVSATLGAEVQHVLRQNWPDAELLIGNCAHKPPARLEHELLPFTGDKIDELRRLLLQEFKFGKALDHAAIGGAYGEPGYSGVSIPRTLIFCRGVQSARAVQHTLVAAGLPTGGCHGSMPESTRRADLAAFRSNPPSQPLLVCTDVSARGIDFPNVEHVVNFDFPATSSLYLHRAGRTARMGRPGLVRSLVHDSERRFAESIRDAVQRKAELHIVRKGDLRERTRADASRGKAYARGMVSREAERIRSDGRRIKKRLRERPAQAPPAGTPAWRVNKHYGRQAVK